MNSQPIRQSCGFDTITMLACSIWVDKSIHYCNSSMRKKHASFNTQPSRKPSSTEDQRCLGKELCYAKLFFFLMLKKGGKFQGAVTTTSLNHLPSNVMLLKALALNQSTTASKARQEDTCTTRDTHTKNFKQEVHANYWVQMFP